MNPGDTCVAERLERNDPLTGRRIIQLTSGDWEDYPLYYFIPSVTRDGKSLIFHRLYKGEVQYHRLDFVTGQTVCLTGARTPNALWRPWLQPRAAGVREYMGAFNQQTEELIYFNSNEIRAVHIYTLKDRLIAEVPRERVPCGLTGVSPDGRYFVYPHAELAWWEANLAAGPQRSSAKGVNIMIVELATGKTRPIVSINSWITHTNFYDNSRITLSHPPTEQGIMMTDLSGEWMLSLRPQSPDGRQTCHYQSTKRGVMYELNDYGSVVDRGHGMMGVFNPETMKRREYRVAARITHIGLDPEGLLWFGEQIIEKPRFGRLIGYCPRLTPDAEGEFVPLTEPIVTCGDQNLQRAHVHPSLMPDRRHILFTGGDLRNRTNHPCLLDVADLAGLHSEKAG